MPACLAFFRVCGRGSPRHLSPSQAKLGIKEGGVPPTAGNGLKARRAPPLYFIKEGGVLPTAGSRRRAANDRATTNPSWRRIRRNPGQERTAFGGPTRNPHINPRHHVKTPACLGFLRVRREGIAPPHIFYVELRSTNQRRRGPVNGGKRATTFANDVAGGRNVQAPQKRPSGRFLITKTLGQKSENHSHQERQDHDLQE